MNFFGKNESLEQSIEKFDSFEKTVWNYFTTYRKMTLLKILLIIFLIIKCLKRFIIKIVGICM